PGCGIPPSLLPPGMSVADPIRPGTGPTSRQELYDRIRASSKDEVVLEEMIRMGFWPEAGASPDDPAEELRRIGELERKIATLAADGLRLRDVEQAKAEMLKRRMKASRERRVETKQKRERTRQERAARWEARKKREILFLGDGVSSALGKRTGKAKDG